jgi:predicted DNA-binding transcriptional regulator AlpA
MPTAKRPSSDIKLPLQVVLDDLGIARRTFYDWRAKNRAPHCLQIPSRQLRIRRSDYHQWLAGLEETPAVRNNYDDIKLTVEFILEDLGIVRSTFDDWRAKSRTPHALRLPNGQLRFYRSDYRLWLAKLEDAA